MKVRSIQLALAISAVSAMLFVASSGLALAKKPAEDPQGDSPLEDFDIRSYGFTGKDPYLQVYGHAGRTLALEEEQIFAYVLYTDSGIWAANNHGFGHEDPEGDEGNIWHSEQIFLNDDGCLTAADNESENRIVGKRVTLIGTGATEISMVQTVELVHVADDPTAAGCPEGSIAKLVGVFDEATS